MDKTNTTVFHAGLEDKMAPPVLLAKPEEKDGRARDDEVTMLSV